LHGGPVVVAGLDGAEHLGLVFIDELAAVIAAHGFQDGRAVARAAVCDRGAVFRKLQRREQAVRLADGRLQRVADIPVRVLELFLHGLRGHLAGALRQLDAGVLAEAEGRGIARERVDRQAVADGVEEDVARVADGLGNVVIAVRRAGGGDPALGRVAGVLILAERAGALDGRAGGDDALGQAGNGRAGFERRARRILAEQRAVEQRLVVRFGDGLVVFLALEERLQVEGRVVCDGQRLTGGDVDRHERAAADGVAVFRGF